MDITSLGGPRGPSSLPERPATDAAQRPAPVGDGTTPSPTSSSSVRLSATAQQFAANGLPSDIDVERVSALRESVRNGTYKINARAIADGFFASFKELFKLRRRRKNDQGQTEWYTVDDGR